MKIRIPTLNAVVWAAVGGTLCIVAIGMFWLLRKPAITIINHAIVNGPASPLTGLPCADPHRRPIAVMISSDPQARPLSGLSAADMVFEMPVTPGGITRMMGVYQCASDPREIGSIRSAREDFIPLAQGLDADFAHWGGEHGALEELNAHIMDNLDALIYEGTVFYRKKGIPAPHNGFSTLTRIREQAAKLGYSATANISGYAHEVGQAPLNLGGLVTTITIPWPQDMRIEYRYDGTSNTYARWRGGQPEIDAATNKQVSAGVVIVMETDSSFLRDQYIRVRTIGQGMATIYQDGRRISATWKKSDATSMLTFTDTTGQTIPFAPGSIWVEITAPLPSPTS